MEKGQRIYIVLVNESEDYSVVPFANYSDALKYAKGQMAMFMDCDERSDCERRTFQQEDVKEGREPISSTPFAARVDNMDTDNDYIHVEIKNTQLN